MLIVETSLSFGREVLRGINRYVVSHQPWSLYLDLRELLVEPPAWLDSWKGDGIVCRSTTPELALKLRRLKVPVVDLTDIHGDLGLPHIWSDHDAVGRLGASHLLERGFRHFAFCGFSDHDWSSRRRDGFCSGLAEQRLTTHTFESPWQIAKSETWDEQQRAIGAWLRDLPKPVGVLAANDMRGQHVLDACRREELAVPEEVAVLGVDNDELLCELCDPPLSSIVLNAQRVGYEAAALLDRLMNGQVPKSHELLVAPIGLVTRQSTDVLAIDDPLVAAALRFIREHACDGIGVEDVLRQVPLARSALERKFRKYLQRSPQAEILAIRLKRIKQLLGETDLALEAIAGLVGYDHAEYMSVVFKRETGQTPGQYRRAVQIRG